MPKSAELNATAAVAAFTIPGGATGYCIHNPNAVNVLFREGHTVTLDGTANKGLTLAPSEKYSVDFNSPLTKPMKINAMIASGTGRIDYEVFYH